VVGAPGPEHAELSFQRSTIDIIVFRPQLEVRDHEFAISTAYEANVSKREHVLPPAEALDCHFVVASGESSERRRPSSRVDRVDVEVCMGGFEIEEGELHKDDVAVGGHD
jgi:hypothetical protein